jgi:diguanylate cyclase (GGDEF)-like protein
MHLDVPTLMAMESFVYAFAGVVLFIAWSQNRKISALALWGLADIVTAGGVLSLTLGFASGQPLGLILGGIVLALSPGLGWKAARTFDAKPAPLILVLLGAVVVGLASSIRSLQDVTWSLSLATSAVYLFAAAATLWLGRKEGLAARWPIIIFTAVQAAVLLIGALSNFGDSGGQNAIPSVMSLFGLIYFQNIVFAVGTTAFILVLVKERSEAASRLAASTDGLTGIANRAAFLVAGERVLERCRHDGAPVAVLMFDLDRFKLVNDTHGHAVGDAVLRKFCEVVATAIRPSDVFGRIGGEEFAVVLPGSSIEAASIRAERIRVTFAENCRFIGNRQVIATVSGGVSVSVNAEHSLSALLEYSDEALYRAKAGGRNRIKRAGQPEPDGGGQSTVIRVA